MTDQETIERLQKEIEEINVELKGLCQKNGEQRGKIKRQRIENGRLNETLNALIDENKKLVEQLKWMKGEI